MADNLKTTSSTPLVIIPDLHGRSFWREAAAAFPEADFIFLGDYLDPYPEDQVSADAAFAELTAVVAFKRLNTDRVVLLWGNHDLHYVLPVLQGSRFDAENAERNRQLFQSASGLFQLACERKIAGRRFLFTHAGVGRGWVERLSPGKAPEEITANWLNGLLTTAAAALYEVSAERGGTHEYGSPVWADLAEQQRSGNQLPGCVQVFGHSRKNAPVNWDNRIYCLDCGDYFVLNLRTGRIYDRKDKELWPFPITVAG